MSRVPEPQVDLDTDQLKLLSRANIETSLATSFVALAGIGVVIMIGLGFLTRSLWQNPKLGATVGLVVTFAGLAGVVLHWVRSRVIDRRIKHLDAGQTVLRPVSETFWTSSSDSDFIFLFTVGVVIAALAYLSAK